MGGRVFHQASALYVRVEGDIVYSQCVYNMVRTPAPISQAGLAERLLFSDIIYAESFNLCTSSFKCSYKRANVKNWSLYGI